jgi:hypothetical protein
MRNKLFILFLASFIIFFGFSCKKDTAANNNNNNAALPTGTIISVVCFTEPAEVNANVTYELSNVSNIAHVYLCLYNWGYPLELPITAGRNTIIYRGVNDLNDYYLQIILNDGSVINTPYQQFHC